MNECWLTLNRSDVGLNEKSGAILTCVVCVWAVLSAELPEVRLLSDAGLVFVLA